VSEKTHRRLRREPLPAAKDLQRRFIAVELNRLGERLLTVGHLDDRHVAQADVLGPDSQNVADNGRHAGVAQEISQSRQHLVLSFYPRR